MGDYTYNLVKVYPHGCSLTATGECIGLEKWILRKPVSMLSATDGLQLATAMQPIRRFEQGNKFYLKSEIYTDSCPKSAYLKLLPRDFIVKEALCWALARTLRLPVSQAYYVDVEPRFLKGIAGIEEMLTCNTQYLFGLEEAGLLQTPVENRRAVERSLPKWQKALDCGVFDDWIVNGDRIPNNLLFAGANKFILIDHDNALPPYASIDTNSTSEVLKKLSEGKNKLQLDSLLRNAEQIFEKISNVDFEQILGMVLHPKVPEISKSLFLEHIGFLQKRAKVLPKIVAESLQGSQFWFKLDDNSDYIGG